MSESSPLLSTRDLVVSYGRGRRAFNAVDRVSLDVERGEVMGIIGESGSGKTSLIKAIAGLVPSSAGSLEIAAGTRANGAAAERKHVVHMIFQDSGLALNPRLPVWKSVVEPSVPRRLWIPRSLREDAVEYLGLVGIEASLADRRPAAMSGGQRQRIALARALAARAPLLLCDEPVAALDVSLQVGILRLLARLRDEHGLTYVFISHDLTSISRLADRIAVMYLGQFVELGPAAAVLEEPRHPYTQALVSAMPRVSKETIGRTRVVLQGEIPDPRRPPSGCRFRTRCLYATERCATEAPLLDDSAGDRSDSHRVACHFWPEIRSGARRPTVAAAEARV